MPFQGKIKPLCFVLSDSVMTTDPTFASIAHQGIAVYANNAEAIGNTPLVRLNRIMPAGVTVLAKIESRNPAFSVKCRVFGASKFALFLLRIMKTCKLLIIQTEGIFFCCDYYMRKLGYYLESF